MGVCIGLPSNTQRQHRLRLRLFLIRPVPISPATVSRVGAHGRSVSSCMLGMGRRLLRLVLTASTSPPDSNVAGPPRRRICAAAEHSSFRADERSASSRTPHDGHTSSDEHTQQAGTASGAAATEERSSARHRAWRWQQSRMALGERGDARVLSMACAGKGVRPTRQRLLSCITVSSRSDGAERSRRRQQQAKHAEARDALGAAVCALPLPALRAPSLPPSLLCLAAPRSLASR